MSSKHPVLTHTIFKRTHKGRRCNKDKHRVSCLSLREVGTITTRRWCALFLSFFFCSTHTHVMHFLTQQRAHTPISPRHPRGNKLAWPRRRDFVDQLVGRIGDGLGVWGLRHLFLVNPSIGCFAQVGTC